MNSRGHLSSETIDLLMLAALDPLQATAAKAHLDGCARCKTRWNELQEDSQQFQQYVYARTVEKVTSRVVKPSLYDRLRIWGPARVLVPAFGGVAAALALTFALTGGGTSSQSEDEIYVGLKGVGNVSLEVVAQRANGQQEPVKAGSVLAPGDRIRFMVNGGGAKYVLIGSKDGSGAFTVYYPFNKTESALLEKGQRELPGAVLLDEVAGREQLVAVFSDEPVKAQDVEAAVKTGPVKLKNARVVSLEFVKDAPK